MVMMDAGDMFGGGCVLQLSSFLLFLVFVVGIGDSAVLEGEATGDLEPKSSGMSGMDILPEVLWASEGVGDSVWWMSAWVVLRESDMFCG